jgi:hypothetical protein
VKGSGSPWGFRGRLTAFFAFGDDSGFFFSCFAGLRAVMMMTPRVHA